MEVMNIKETRNGVYIGSRVFNNVLDSSFDPRPYLFVRSVQYLQNCLSLEIAFSSSILRNLDEIYEKSTQSVVSKMQIEVNKNNQQSFIEINIADSDLNDVPTSGYNNDSPIVKFYSTNTEDFVKHVQNNHGLRSTVRYGSIRIDEFENILKNIEEGTGVSNEQSGFDWEEKMNIYNQIKILYLKTRRNIFTITCELMSSDWQQCSKEIINIIKESIEEINKINQSEETPVLPNVIETKTQNELDILFLRINKPKFFEEILECLKEMPEVTKKLAKNQILCLKLNEFFVNIHDLEIKNFNSPISLDNGANMDFVCVVLDPAKNCSLLPKFLNLIPKVYRDICRELLFLISKEQVLEDLVGQINGIESKFNVNTIYCFDSDNADVRSKMTQMLDYLSALKRFNNSISLSIRDEDSYESHCEPSGSDKTSNVHDLIRSYETLIKL